MIVLTTERTEDDGLPLQAEEEVVASFPGTGLSRTGDEAPLPGDLVVTNQRAAWLARPGPNVVSVDFPSIALHAVCRDTSSYPHPCLYCQVTGDSEESDLRFVPGDAEQLSAMFAAFSDVAARFPPEDEEDDAGELIFNQGEVEEGASAAVLGHLEAVFDAGPFADADAAGAAQHNGTGDEDDAEDAGREMEGDEDE